jgi:uncharacterized protein (DUF1501 family)
MAYLHKNISRRRALKMMGSSVAMTGGAFAFNLASIGSIAQAQSFGDFKALVCIFLYGGNDQSNTVIPRSGQAYQDYYDARPSLARAADDLLEISPAGWTGPDLGLPPELGAIHPLFASGDLAIAANVGTLLYPTTLAQIENGSAFLPRQLFSHSDQQNSWQSGLPDQSSATGWLGRIGDSVNPLANDGSPISIAMSMAGNNLIQAGEDTLQYQLTTNGPIGIAGLDDLYDSPEAGAAYRQLVTSQSGNRLMREYAAITGRAIQAEDVVSAALAGAQPLTTTFPSTYLGRQLNMVARMIAARSALGQTRQIYFVSQGGWDHHDNLLTGQAANLQVLGDAMGAFHAATQEMGVADSVTSFTASDFGRALQFNGRGSDHGWGSHHFVMGGAVRGGRVYGTWPDVVLGASDDVGQGRLIPTASVDEYAGELAQWFGVPISELGTVIPHLSRFDRANMSFLS